MPAAIKHYRVRVRIVPWHDRAFEVNADAHASNAHDARKIAERAVAADYPDARAIVGVSQRRVKPR